MKRQRPASPAVEFAVSDWMLSALRFAVRHWLAAVTLLAGTFFLLALAAPVFMALGWTQAAEAIHALYAHACHQLPEASYFLWGQEALVQVDSDLPAGRATRSFRGEAVLGYKTALCQRNLATYGALALMGVVYIRKGLRLQPLPFWAGGLLIVPMAVDGLTQMWGLRESHWMLRSLTGSLFSTGLAWTLWPRIQRAMEEVRRDLERIQSERTA